MMNLIRKASLLSALALLLAIPVQAEEKVQLQDVSEPTEVGNTTMPTGQYAITEQVSGKSYNLTVTSKGLMILSPSAKGAATTTAPANTANVAAGGAVNSAVAGGQPAKGAMNGLINRGLEQGVQELMKSGATKQLNKYIK